MSLAMATTFHSHDDYFAAQAPEQRDRLVQIQRTVDAVVPGAQHIISYNRKLPRQADRLKVEFRA